MSGSWCSQNEHYLLWFNDCWNRVKILAREDDDWKVLCVDTGEEKFVKYKSLFYRAPKPVSLSLISKDNGMNSGRLVYDFPSFSSENRTTVR